MHSFTLLPSAHDKESLILVACAFHALKDGIQTLKQYYSELDVNYLETVDLKEDRQMFYPYRDFFTMNGMEIRFKYKKRLQDQKLLFLVDIVNAKEKTMNEENIITTTQLLIKFARSYVNLLAGGWKIIVMEYLLPEQFVTVYEALSPPDTIKSNRLLELAKNSVSLLHNARYVHGDIRTSNLMISN
ncbi:909_t:CDS:2, partial [Paraglomus occultum]